jgi:hypothetical protein
LESDNRWGCTPTFFVRDNFGFAAFEDSNHRVCGTKVNSDDFAHFYFVPKWYHLRRGLRASFMPHIVCQIGRTAPRPDKIGLAAYEIS